MSTSSNKIKSIIFILIFMLVVFFQACERQKQYKVCVIGLDSATWAVIDPLIEKGLMPNLKRIRDEGAIATMTPFEPCSSIELWTTMATGKSTGKHGISSWVEYNPNSDRYVPMTSNSRKTKALWNILGDYGKTSFFINWYATWPAENIQGIMLTNRFMADMSPESFWPPDLSTPTLAPWSIDKIDCIKAFVEGNVTADTLQQEPNFLREDLEQFGQEFYREDFLASIGHELYHGQESRSDLYAIMLRALDTAQHFFWQYTNPRGFSPTTEHIAKYQSIIPRLLVYYDRLIGDYLSSLGDDTILIIISDHGMSGFTRENLPRSYVGFEDISLFFPEEDGHCIIRGIKASNFLQHLNKELQSRALPTLRWCDVFYAENITLGHNWRLKLCFEERTPTVLQKRDEVLGLLEGLKTDTPQVTPLFSSITPGDTKEFDIMVQFSRDISNSATLKLGGEQFVWSDFLDYHRRLSGIHLEDKGIVVFHGPCIKKGVRISSFVPQEIAPTILNLLRIPVGQDMDGQARLDFLDENIRERFQPQLIETHDRNFRLSTISRGSQLDTRILHELESLGYIPSRDSDDSAEK